MGAARGFPHTAELSEWHSPATHYPEGRVGEAAVERIYYPPGTYHCYLVGGFDYFVIEESIPITTLTIGGKTWMVDDPPHWWGMQEHAREYRGHVLCAGLGLGLMVHALTLNPEVSRITVVERSSDVIGLISPLVPDEKLEIIEGDFYDMDAHRIPDVDGVLFDLFVGDGRELLSAGIDTSVEIMLKWAVNRDDFVMRVHGLPNPLIQNAAEATIEGRKRVWRNAS